MPDAPAPNPWPRRLAWLGGALTLGLVLAVGVSILALDRSIDRVEVEGLGSSGVDADRSDRGGDGAEAIEVEEEDASEDAEALTVLVLGSDSRANLSEQEQDQLGTGYAPGYRTEVMALVRLSPEDREVRVLNLPRDSRVERCDGSDGRINGAYEVGEEDGRGGMSCTVQTVTRLTGTPIDHVVAVEFGGFVDIVDDLGGVSMYLDEPLEDAAANLDLPAGCVELDGADALAFVRARHLDDDFGRIARQQRFIAEVLEELSGLGVIDDLPRLVRVATSVARSVELDSSLDLVRLQQLVREHRATLRGGIEGRILEGEPVTVYGAWMLELDEERTEELVTWLLRGEDPAEPTEGEGRSSASEDVIGEPETLGGSEPVGADPDAVGRC